MFKVIYLAKRNPNTTHAEFLINWKQHAELSATFPSIHDVFLAVIQCSSVTTVSRSDISSGYDGVNLLPVRGLVDALGVYDDLHIDVMRSDELRVFSTYVAESSLSTIEIISSHEPVGSVVILEFARRRTGVTKSEFAQAWGGRRVRALNAVPAFTAYVGRHVRNLVVLDRPPGYEYDGIAELWFEGVEQAVALLDDAQYRSCGNDEEFTVPLRLLLKTNYVWYR